MSFINDSTITNRFIGVTIGNIKKYISRKNSLPKEIPSLIIYVHTF